MTPFEDAASREEEEGWLCGSTEQAATEPLLRLWDSGQSVREGQTACAAAGRAELLMGTPQPWWGHERAGRQWNRAWSTSRFARLLTWRGAGCTYRYWGASGGGKSGLLVPASDDLKEAMALN